MLIIKSTSANAPTEFRPADPAEFVCVRIGNVLRIFKPAVREGAAALEELLQQYDHARDVGLREAISEQVYDLVGGRLRSLVGRAAGGKIDATDADTFARMALQRGLAESGLTRFRRDDGVWESLVGRMRSNDPQGSRLWRMLSPNLQGALSARYLKATTTDYLIRELNELLKRPRLAADLGVQASAFPEESQAAFAEGTATGITLGNAVLLNAVFPNAIHRVGRPHRDLLGYIASAVLPKMRGEIRESAGQSVLDPETTKVIGHLRPIIGELDELVRSGRLPEGWDLLPRAEQVSRLYRARLQETYGPIIAWWEDQLRRVGRPFAIKDANALRTAKELFSEHGVDPMLWQAEGSPYYLPQGTVKVYGKETIQRALDAMESERAMSRPVPIENARPRARQPSQRLPPAWLADHRDALWTRMLGRLYPLDSAEHAVGSFSQSHPMASESEITQYVGTLPPEIQDDIDALGWRQIARDVGQRIIQELQRPEIQSDLIRELGLHPGALSSSISASIRLAEAMITLPFIRIA